MGEVYLAKSGGIAGIDRLCVLKKLRPDLVQNEEYVRRFLDEARLVVQLNHANIANVFDVGKVGGEYYLAMEYVSGVSMKGLLTRAETETKQLPPDVVVYMMAEALEGLDYAHGLEHPTTGQPLNLVHRDISPHNIMVSYEGEVKLIDFGLAASELKEEQTESQVVMGKVAYMAPEQARGERVNAACDQFAAGIVLYELLVGERFYGDMNNYQIWQVVGRGGHVPARWAELDEELTPILGRALHPDASARWPSCGELKDALMAWLLARYPRTSRRTVRGEVRELFEDDTKKERSFLGQFSDVDPAELRSESGSGSLSASKSVENVHLITAGEDATMTATAFDSKSEPATSGPDDPTVPSSRGDTGPTAANVVPVRPTRAVPSEPQRRAIPNAAIAVVAVAVGVGLGVLAVSQLRGERDAVDRPANKPAVEAAESAESRELRQKFQEIDALLRAGKREEAVAAFAALASGGRKQMSDEDKASWTIMQKKMAKMEEAEAGPPAKNPDSDVTVAKAGAAAKPLSASADARDASAAERAANKRAAQERAANKRAANKRAAAKRAARKTSPTAAAAKPAGKLPTPPETEPYSAAELQQLKVFFEACGGHVLAAPIMLERIKNSPKRLKPDNYSLRKAIRACRLQLGSKAPPVP